MRCKHAHMTVNSQLSTFTFRDEGDMEYTVNVNYENKWKEDIRINFFAFKEKEERVKSVIQSMMVYIPNQEDVKMFTYIFQYLSTFHNYATTVRTIPYPGKTLIVVDYGTLAIDKETIEKLSKAIIQSILTKSKQEVVEEEEVEDEQKPFLDQVMDDDETSDYPLPFTTSDEYVQDDFSIGVVEYD